MEDNQVKVVAQVNRKEGTYNHTRQIPTFFVNAYCFVTAKSIVKDIFKGQNMSGQMEDSKGYMKNFNF